MSEVIVKYSDNGYGNVIGEMIGELVRCKECVFRNQKYLCQVVETDDDDFCSYGEREGE